MINSMKSITKTIPLLTFTVMLSACPPIAKDGYVLLEDWIVESDMNETFIPNEGDINVLIVPIEFKDTTYNQSDKVRIEDTTNFVDTINKVYFGNSENEISLKEYFANVSLNKIEVKGKVAPIYENSDITIDQINMDSISKETMLQLFDAALENACKSLTEEEKKLFDKDSDGYVDVVNFITNYTAPYESPLWPHSWSMQRELKEGSLSYKRYSVSSLYYLNTNKSNNIAIHEFSHLFGLMDYYSYTDNKDVNYVGTFDMQSNNQGDWNAFSKFSVGWGNPYVVTEENKKTAITIGNSQETGDYIIVPADYKTFNGSPFDEYYLVELLCNKKNNRLDFTNFVDISTLSSKCEYGVRIYHVNATMSFVKYETYHNRGYYEEYSINSRDDIAKAKKDIAKAGGINAAGIIHATNNSFNSSDFTHVDDYDNFPLLSVIQKNKINTFGRPGSDYRKDLKANDLFYAGEEFEIDRYGTFNTKDYQNIKLMNNGEDFPYVISIDTIDINSATISIKKA